MGRACPGSAESFGYPAFGCTAAGGTFQGAASTYLAHARPGARVAVTVRPSQAAFHPPESLDTPSTRWGVATSHDRVLLCGSGARRGGAVSGLGGHNAAMAALELLG